MELIGTVLALAAAAAVGVLTWLGRRGLVAAERWAEQRWNIEIDDQVRSYLEDAFQNGLRYGAQRVRDAVVTSLPAARKLQLDAATDYVMSAVPDGLARMGIAGRDDVMARLKARLDDVQVQVAKPADAHGGP